LALRETNRSCSVSRVLRKEAHRKDSRSMHWLPVSLDHSPHKGTNEIDGHTLFSFEGASP
jgi:hypothetical protein